MATYTTFAKARANLAALWRQVEETGEPVIIRRAGHEDLVLMCRAELQGSEETEHLMRSPENARRLLSALLSSMAGDGIPCSTAALRADLGLDAER